MKTGEILYCCRVWWRRVWSYIAVGFDEDGERCYIAVGVDEDGERCYIAVGFDEDGRDLILL